MTDDLSQATAGHRIGAGHGDGGAGPVDGSGRLQAPANGVTVRMYGHGFGDCFLLAFPSDTPGESYYVLIDCGVHQSFEGGSDMMRRVAADIAAATGGELDLVVVTHRHADHISGFTQARKIFAEEIQVHKLWLSWLEDPKNLPADLVWGEVENAVEGVRRFAASRPESPVADLAPVLDFLPSMGEGFEGPVPRPGGGTGVRPPAGFRPEPAPVNEEDLDGLPIGLMVDGPEEFQDVEAFAAMPVGDEGIELENAEALAARPKGGARADRLQDVRALARGDESRIAYLQPGHGPQALPATGARQPPAGLQVFVLGPPGRATALKQEEGTRDGGEEYALALTGVAGPDAATRIGALLGMLAAPSMSSDAQADLLDNLSFDVSEIVSPKDAWFGDITAGGEEGEEAVALSGPDELSSLAASATLQLDDYVNNTSLVLAFELSKSKKVLLFAADAQVGNWVSWPEVLAHDTGAGPVTTAGVLGRTVLYKVGHHGSGNATVRARGGQPWGLELMTHEDLVALLPTEREWARRIPGWEDMPYHKLMTRLNERTAGRILRADTGLPRPEVVQPEAWSGFQAGITASPDQVTPPRYEPSRSVIQRGKKLGLPPDDPRLHPYDPPARPFYFDVFVED